MTPPLFLASTEMLAGADVGGRVVLDGAEGKHAADVRRLVRGEAISVADGRGLVVTGVVADVTRGRVTVEVQQREVVEPASPRFVVVQAVAKGGRDSDAVEAMTELGVDVVVGWQASRSVAKWTERSLAKWSAAAREAAKQSRRAWVPEVSGPADTADVAALLRASSIGVVLHESADASLANVSLPSSGDVVVVVGPEGGITDAELTTFRADGAHVCRLGSSVLRTSTAGVAALAVLSAKSRWH